MRKKICTIIVGVFILCSLCACTKRNGKNVIDYGDSGTEETESELNIQTDEEISTDITVAETTETQTEVSVINPTEEPTEANTQKPTESSTKASVQKPTEEPTEKLTEAPTVKPTEAPTAKPTEAPTVKPTEAPTAKPTEAPTVKPTEAPTVKPTEAPTQAPTEAPTQAPVVKPTTDKEMVKYVLNNIITPQMSLADKIYEVHKWMVNNIQYDTTYSKYHAYNALIEGSAVCQGYAEAFSLFMDELGVPCKMITGTADNGGKAESHAWNAVQLNGGWYYIDVTWDDPLMSGHSNYPDGSNRSHEYYLVTESMIGTDHFPGVALPTPAGTDLSYHNNAVAKRNSEVMAVKVQEYTAQGYKAAAIGSASEISNAVSMIDNYGNYAFVFNINNVTSDSIIGAVKERVKSINNSVINGYSLKCPYGNDGVSDIWYVLVELSKSN